MKFSAVLLAVTLVTGCQFLEERRKVDYRDTPSSPPLEVPPGLSGPSTTVPGTTTYSTYSDVKPGTGGVLPKYQGIKFIREAQARYLVVEAEPEQLWESAREFFRQNKLTIAKEDAGVGIIESGWVEKQEEQESDNAIQFLSSLFNRAGDRFRLRLERGAKPGTTEIYFSLRQRAPGENGNNAMWRAGESEREIEMLQRLASHLGADAAVTKAIAATTHSASPIASALLTRAGDMPLLRLEDGPDRAWRRVGLSLDRIGFTVEDRDRSKGIYYIRYIDPDKPVEKPGFFARMFGRGEPPSRYQYQVRLKPADVGTSVDVLDKDGAPETSKTGERILALLYEQLR